MHVQLLFLKDEEEHSVRELLLSKGNVIEKIVFVSKCYCKYMLQNEYDSFETNIIVWI
jgi:hypothetical protein